MQTHKFLASKYLLIFAIVICFFVILMGFKTPENDYKPTSHTVIIFRMKFAPADLIVKKGDTVVWINKDFFPHDVTEFTSQKWSSKPLNQGEEWSMVINEDVKYFCNLHKVMKGTISIQK